MSQLRARRWFPMRRVHRGCCRDAPRGSDPSDTGPRSRAPRRPVQGRATGARRRPPGPRWSHRLRGSRRSRGGACSGFVHQRERLAVTLFYPADDLLAGRCRAELESEGSVESRVDERGEVLAQWGAAAAGGQVFVLLAVTVGDVGVADSTGERCDLVGSDFHRPEMVEIQIRLARLNGDFVHEVDQLWNRIEEGVVPMLHVQRELDTEALRVLGDLPDVLYRRSPLVGCRDDLVLPDVLADDEEQVPRSKHRGEI